MAHGLTADEVGRLRPYAVDRLARAGCVAAHEEADEYLAAAPDVATLEAWLDRRATGEPPAWITGSLVFCGQRLHVSPGVYVPRPQTEELARRAGELLPAAGRAADLCTGAGAVAAYLAAHEPSATVVGVDVDPRAAACARRNGVMAVVADIADALCGNGTFDVVTAVAPYVPSGAIGLLSADVQRWEPRLALDGGADGLDLVRRVIVTAARLLRPGGWLLLELGGEQRDALDVTFDAAGIEPVLAWHDEDGDLRGIAARRT